MQKKLVRPVLALFSFYFSICGHIFGQQDQGGLQVVLNGDSLWRNYVVSRNSYVRNEDKKLEFRNVIWYWGGIRSEDCTESGVSPLPPANWQISDFNDTAWPRLRLPQPELTVSGANPRPFFHPYSKAMVFSRGSFNIADHTPVKECVLNVKYFGGVAVYVNGKEVARGHLPAGQDGELAFAEDYTDEAFVTEQGKPIGPNDVSNKERLALRERTLNEIKIPVNLLRAGVNVVAIQNVTAPLPAVMGKGKFGQDCGGKGWPPVGLLEAEVKITTGCATPSARPAGLQVWNVNNCETVTSFDYGDVAVSVRPIEIRAGRNTIFSGRLMVGSDTPIRNLQVKVSDLQQAGGKAKIGANAVQARLAEAATAEKTWSPAFRFDALVDKIPAEIPVIAAKSRKQGFYSFEAPRQGLISGALASLWFTVTVPKEVVPGLYEGVVSVAAEGLAEQKVPLRLSVSQWTAPDPKDFRVHHFAYYADDALALHYGVERWSDRHFALIEKSLKMLAEVNSRQAILNLVCNFYGGNKGDFSNSNTDTLVRWIDDGKGGYRYDFTLFDRYLDLIAKAIGKPSLLRVNCWGETTKTDGRMGHNGATTHVQKLDPATGKLDLLEIPPPGTEESYTFWKPVLDEVRRKIEARGWWDVAAMGHNSYCYPAKPEVVSVLHRIWPDGVWSYTAHNGVLGASWTGLDKEAKTAVFHADSVWNAGKLTARGYQALLSDKRPRGYWCFTYRGCFNDGSSLVDLRRIAEDEIMMGHDGVSDFGGDLFPLKNERGHIFCIGNGRGTGGPGNSTKAVLAPGPDGAISTERFEMLREGTQLAEAILFIQRALNSGALSEDLAKRCNEYLDQRGAGFLKGWYNVWQLQVEHDMKLLSLADEVARVVQK